MNPYARRISLFPLVIALAGFGCGSPKVPMTLAELDAGKIEYLERAIADQGVVAETIMARWEEELRTATTPEDRIFDVLVLSGGGDKGAFGAGFLVGWGEVNEPGLRRPEFDLVSGVSTGAMIAPMALIGTEEAYRTTDEVYRNPQPWWVRERGLLDFLFGESYYDDGGLLRLAESQFGPVLPTIAERAADHRLLAVTAVNISQGLPRVFNMSALAEEVQAGRMTVQEWCRHVIASASIPVAFPPQLIDGSWYVDGSTTGDISVSLDAGMQGRLIQEWKRRHPGVQPPTIRLWVIANTPLVTGPAEVQPTWSDVVGRSLDLSIRVGLITQLTMLEASVKLLRTTEGCDIELRFVSLPDGWSSTAPGLFNKVNMVPMSDLGRKMGRDPSSWQTSVHNAVAMPAVLQRLEQEERTDAGGATTP